MISSPDGPSIRKAERSSGTLVIGDDSVCNAVVRRLPHQGNVIFVRLKDWDVDPTDDQTQLTLDIDHVTELFRGEFDIVPNAAIIATSRDCQNLMIVVHLQIKFDFEEIVVRINAPQYLDAFADLSVELVNDAEIVGSALVQKLDRSVGFR